MQLKRSTWLCAIAAVATVSACDNRSATAPEELGFEPLVSGKPAGSDTTTTPRPRPDSTPPRPDSTRPRPDSTPPRPDSTPPRPDSTRPRPDSTPPRPDSTRPRPDSTPPRPDSTRPRPDSTPPRPDSTRPQLPASVTLSGKVVAIVVITPAPASGDTVRFDPVVGATVKIYRNVLSDGVASQVLVAQGTSAAGGAYVINGIPGGYYLIRTTPPVGSNLRESTGYLAGTQAVVKQDIYLWRAP